MSASADFLRASICMNPEEPVSLQPSFASSPLHRQESGTSPILQAPIQCRAVVSEIVRVALQQIIILSMITQRSHTRSLGPTNIHGILLLIGCNLEMLQIPTMDLLLEM